MQAIKYELKYCERCGSLRLRPTDSGETYCGPCAQVLGKFSHVGKALPPEPAVPPPLPGVVEAGALAQMSFWRMP